MRTRSPVPTTADAELQRVLGSTETVTEVATPSIGTALAALLDHMERQKPSSHRLNLYRFGGPIMKY
ncbi:hypothetical protein [Arthrobacter sp. NPDC093139]|uniref:hypothetical protein n=1 Tax=Arthrobacter sp. NPDC093139 TaxID=3363945 RepID=UPI0038183498